MARRVTVLFTALIAVGIIIILRLNFLNKSRKTLKQSMSLLYKINHTWNGADIKHAPISIHLATADEGVAVRVIAPFFNDPPKPSGAYGKPFDKLWDYEVVEVFFLNDHEEYLEVELCPHGQHLVLKLKGVRKIVESKLPLEFSVEMRNKEWVGNAVIPFSYFPKEVVRFNAYAIHGSSASRTYEALYPSPPGAHDTPDFHRLQYFKSLPFDKFIPPGK